MGQQRVAKREDSWVEVPAETSEGFSQGPIQLRPGGDESKIRIKIAGSFEQEVEIDDLETGIDEIRKEHAR